MYFKVLPLVKHLLMLYAYQYYFVDAIASGALKGPYRENMMSVADMTMLVPTEGEPVPMV
jgi:hypothetical protein